MRVRPRRSTVKSLQVREVPLPVIRDVICRNHYSRSCPAAALHAFGIYSSDRLGGAAVVTIGALRSYRLLHAGRPGDVVTLSRLWLADSLPRNAESRVLAVLVRLLRRKGTYRALVTFADPEVGHDGIIYRAAGFRYLGVTQPERYVEIRGTRCHPRSVASMFGSNDVGHLSRTGVPAVRTGTSPKHRYAAVLDPAWGWRLRPPESSFQGGYEGK